MIGLIAYGIAWVRGLARFSPEPFEWVAPYAGNSASPVMVFVIDLVVAATIVTLFSAREPPAKRSAGA